MRKPLLAVLLTSAFFAQQAQAADLLQVYKQALVNDAQYASARSALTAGKEKLPQAKASLLPSVALSGNNSRVYSDRADFNTYAYSLALNQPLFRPALWENYSQAQLAVAASEASFAQSQQDLIVRVAQAYFDVLTAQDALEAVKAQKVATSEQLASAKRNFEVGTQTITDTHEAQSRFDLIVAQEIAAQNEVEIKRTALQQIIGQAPTGLAGLRNGVVLNAPQPAQMEAWVESAEKQNYSVISSQINLNSAKYDIKRNRTGHLPTVDLQVKSERLNQGGGRNNSNSIGVQWNVPIFSGFGVDSRVRESIALEDKARNDLEVAKRAAAQGARQAFFGVSAGLAQVKALEAAEVSSKSALESNKLGYQVGVRINIDVLNAQQQVYSTRKDLSKARYDTLVNGLRLKAAAGNLKEDDVVAVNALLQN